MGGRAQLFGVDDASTGFELLADLVAALFVERVEADEQEYAGGHDDGEEDEEGAHFEEGVFGLRCFDFHVEARDIGNAADKGHGKRGRG